ncbi:MULTISPECIES: HD domain-containing protein [Clostridia]|uniref:HD domain-containing protein n=1 Tax=Clostridia TaxID=186801 RepID=UPI000EA2DDAF|nr:MULTISPECIES: HD domain-containing protein [Clostridia]NBJ69969.1 HD domain-containing protein [Roseburia sp. 1XD42-34]RKI77540.1 HD domain-containing protein [Clostridium sp. 1xD42-85]
MQAKEQLTEIKYFVRRLFRDDITGHDYYHMQRVAHLARLIAEEEGADSFICEAAAWLHDVGDDKLFTNPDMVEKELDGLLQQLSLSQQQISAITQAMQDVSFRKGKNPKTLEGKVVQDADRLDAVGAIGIARAFAYSGAKGRPLYHEKKDNHTIQHFYDKLLRIPDKLHTTTAKTIAEDRHQVLKRFLEQFYQEWNYTLENE